MNSTDRGRQTGQMTRSHVLVLPGGGYTHHAAHEGEPVAGWLRSLGLEASVLLYPVETRHPGPLDAVRAEIRRVRASGAERVAVLGFSAGGHAAGMAALAPGAAAEERVDAAILCYPVVSMQLDSHRGSREQLIGPEASPELRAATSLDRLVTASAPPFFVWHTAEDGAVPVEHSFLLGSALAAERLPHSLHVFPRGEHGLGLAAGRGTAAEWPGLCAAWLRELGWID
jgi:acetyl esterase/lipase